MYNCTIVLFQRSPKNKHQMPSNSSELAVAPGFYSSAMIGVIITTFEQSFEAFQSSASEPTEPLMTSAYDVQLLMTTTSEPLVFRTSFDQNAFLLHKLPFCRFHCSHLFFSTYAFKDTKFLSMVLHTWTNISISNWQFFNTLLSSKLKG